LNSFAGENTVAEFSGLWDVSALLRRFIYAPGAIIE